MPIIQFGKFIVRVALGLISLICSHALLLVLQGQGIYPETYLAEWLIKAPSAFAINLTQVLLTLLIAIILWGIADYLLYRRRPKAIDVGTLEGLPDQTGVTQNKDRPFPDMTIRELFFLIDPDVLDKTGKSPEPWEKVGRDILDALISW